MLSTFEHHDLGVFELINGLTALLNLSAPCLLFFSFFVLLGSAFLWLQHNARIHHDGRAKLFKVVSIDATHGYARLRSMAFVFLRYGGC